MSQKTKTCSSTRAAGIVRCAIYTRKSTQEGLDREFSSLDAQREAAQAYIASQRPEGWLCLPDCYDDGGFTGGNLDRPALTGLLADIQAGKIDCVVVQRVDRLSRSLLDFAKLMETFEKHRVSFVSVAQQLNSATSMGRLVLNVLLSFAQFEREMIAERTRDKIAATRRKGKWCGGLPVLGYDVDPRGPRLVVNKKEAARVRAIFALYLEHGSLERVVQELDRRGWVNKRWQTRKEHQRGGRPFTKTSLHQLLTNVTYTGRVRHKSEVHPGEHAAIVEPELWQRVQELLRQNGRTGGAPVRNRFGALLKGLLHCAPCGGPMTPTHTTRHGNLRYRYYACLNSRRGGRRGCPSPSIPAPDVERCVVAQIRAVFQDPAALGATAAKERPAGPEPLTDNALCRLRSLFGPAWEASPAGEQARVLGRLVERVDYDGTQGKLAIRFSAAGIQTLTAEAATKARKPWTYR